MSLKSVINDVITTTAGDAIDIVRIMSLVGFGTFLGLAVYSVVTGTGHHFDMQSFGIGLGGVIAATGVGIRMNPDNHTQLPPLLRPTEQGQ